MNTEIKTQKATVYEFLEEIKKVMYKYLYNGPTCYALQLLEPLIQLIPPDIEIPPGRPYASESKKLNLDMKGMAMELLYGHGEEPRRPEEKEIEHVMLTVLDWLKQSEIELKQHLIFQLIQLFTDLAGIVSLVNEIEEKKADITERITIIQRALQKVEREGSAPVIDEKILYQKISTPM